MNLLPNEHVVSLVSLNQGAAVELFDKALHKVLDNIHDPETDPAQKREITLKFTFNPDVKSRDGKRLDVLITCDTKLSGQRAVGTTVYMGKVEGQLQAVEADPNQGVLFDDSITKGKLQ